MYKIQYVNNNDLIKYIKFVILFYDIFKLLIFQKTE